MKHKLGRAVIHDFSQPIRNRAHEYLTEEWKELSANAQIYVIGCVLDKPMRLASGDTGIQFLKGNETISTKIWQHLENAYHTGGSI